MPSPFIANRFEALMKFGAVKIVDLLPNHPLWGDVKEVTEMSVYFDSDTKESDWSVEMDNGQA
jgi:hypothetical protein